VTSHGVRSSRVIERLCCRDARGRFIGSGAVPDHTVIARFRQRHMARMREVFLTVLRLCHEAGLVRLGLVALDGTKVGANAALEANRAASRIDKKVPKMRVPRLLDRESSFKLWVKTIPCANAITLTAEEWAVLEALSRSTKSEVRMRMRARIVLLAAGGTPTREIGRIVGCTTGTASKWRVHYARDHLAGFVETGNRSAKAKYGVAEQQRILALLDQPPPAGHANSPKRFAFAAETTPLLARALCNLHEQYIWRFLRAQNIDLSSRKSWCESNDPEFVAKAAEVEPRGAPAIVGLYMAPPKHAVILSIDEKPSIQALERAQVYLKLPTGRAMTGRLHNYKRHDTTTLFATLEVATGKVTGRYDTGPFSSNYWAPRASS